VKRPVGVVGLGAMGGAIARHLVASGFPVTVHDLSETAVAAMAAAGATAARTAREVAAASEVVLLSLPNPEAVEAVILAPDGVAAGLRSGAVVVDTSTSDPAVTQRLAADVAAAGGSLIDVPLGKGPAAAATGDLTLMAGGDADVIDSCADVLDTVGSRRYHCGPVGSGHAMKLANNLVSCAMNALVAEAMTLGAKAGLRPETMLEVMSNTAADNWHLRHTFPMRVFTGRFEPNFKLALAHKDLGLAVRFAGAQRVPAPIAAAAHELHGRALKAGLGDEDQGAVVKVLERAAGVEVRAAER